MNEDWARNSPWTTNLTLRARRKFKIMLLVRLREYLDSARVDDQERAKLLIETNWTDEQLCLVLDGMKPPPRNRGRPKKVLYGLEADGEQIASVLTNRLGRLPTRAELYSEWSLQRGNQDPASIERTVRREKQKRTSR